MNLKQIALLLILLVTFPPMNAADSPVFEIKLEIESPPEQVWDAIVNPAIVRQYHFAPLLKIEQELDGVIQYGTAEAIMFSGKVTEVTAEKSLSHTFIFGAVGHAGTEHDTATTVAYQLEPSDVGTLLTLTHSGFESENQTNANVTGGWPIILANMKEFLETSKL